MARPVAWRFRHVNYVDWSYAKEKPKADHLEIQPLVIGTQLDKLQRAVRAYLSECDNPRPDYKRQWDLKNRVRDLVGGEALSFASQDRGTA